MGWVTMDNQSGKTFENARIKFMAGDVNKIRAGDTFAPLSQYAIAGTYGGRRDEPPVTEKTFDEYHLYTLQRPATLRDGETNR